MAIDPSISLAIRPPVIPVPQIQTPLEQFAKVLSLRNLMTQGQSGQLGLKIQQLQYEQALREEQQRKDYATLLGQNLNPPSAVAAPGAPLSQLVTPPPVLPTPLGGTVGQTSPPLTAPAAPQAPLSALMAQQDPVATAPAAPLPATAGQGGLRLPGGLTAAQLLARLPDIGPGLLKHFFEAQKEQADVEIKHHDEQKKRWDAMAGAAQAVMAAKDPKKAYASNVSDLYNGGYINQQEAQAFLDHGYDPDTLEGWKNRAIGQTDFHANQKTDLLTNQEALKNAAVIMRGINDQTDYDTKFLPNVTPYVRSVLGNTFSPQLKSTVATLDVPSAELPKTQLAQIQTDAVRLSNAMKAGPKATAEVFASLSPISQGVFAGAQTWQDVINAPLTGEQLKPGTYVPKPQSVIQQEHATQAAKERVKADPFGLFAGITGEPTAGTAATGVTPSPLAQAIATFEGFNKAGSVAQKNNNPGNLRAGPGQTGTDKGGYAIFPDLKTGWAALHDLIQKRSADDLTLQEFFGGKKGVYPGYAPAADRNDPTNYAATVAKQLGVDPTAKLADIPSSQVPTARGRLTPDMRGQAVLDALPGALAQQVKALAEGRMALPTGRAAASGYWQQMLGLVGQYDPSFDVNNPGKRAATAKAFAAGGVEARQVNALGTAIGHVDNLRKAADKLNNTSWPIYNTLANYLSEKTGSPEVTNFRTVRNAVVDELVRAWRGTGGSEADIKSWAKSLDDANSPAQLQGAFAEIGELLETKLGKLEDQYREGMGTISQGRQMITPETRKTLDRLKAGGAPAPASNPNPNGYTPGHRYGGMTYLGGDPNNRASWK